MSRPGRPEQPIDSTAGPLPRLAGELRQLRGDRTYRELADETGLSVAALRAAAAGTQVPTWRVTRAFIAACGGDEGTVRGLWDEACAATGRPVPASPPSAEPPPVPDPDADVVAGDAQFVEALKNLRVWAGSPSLADLNRRSGGFRLPPSTVSEMLRKPKLPRLDLVLAYVRACGLNDEQAAAWEQAWAVLKAREMHEQLSGAGEPGQVSQAVLGESQAARERRRRATWAAFRDFLVWMSGARPDIVARTPADRAVYTAVGGTILLTSAITALSAAFALHVALTLSAPAATAAGVLWGVGITGLDRVLVASIQRGQRLKNFLVAIPRVLLALLLGLVIATPITLRIFSPEINAQIVATQASTDQAASRSAENPYYAQVAADYDQITAYQQRVEDDQHELSCALYGGPNCPGPAGEGPLAKAAEDALTSDQTAMASLQSQVSELRGQQLAAEERAVNVTNQNQQGLLSRLDALDQLADHDAFIAGARLLLFILFVLIGCTPLIVRAVKVFGSHDADEKILRAQELADLQLASQHELARELIAARARVERARLLAWQERELLEIAKDQNPRPSEDGYDAELPAASHLPSATEG